MNKSAIKLLLLIAGFFFSIGSLFNFLQEGDSYSRNWSIGSIIEFMSTIIWIVLDKNNSN